MKLTYNNDPLVRLGKSPTSNIFQPFGESGISHIFRGTNTSLIFSKSTDINKDNTISMGEVTSLPSLVDYTSLPKSTNNQLIIEEDIVPIKKYNYPTFKKRVPSYQIKGV